MAVTLSWETGIGRVPTVVMGRCRDGAIAAVAWSGSPLNAPLAPHTTPPPPMLSHMYMNSVCVGTGVVASPCPGRDVRRRSQFGLVWLVGLHGQLGRSALHIAAHSGRLETCEFLLLNGACADTETNVRAMRCVVELSYVNNWPRLLCGCGSCSSHALANRSLLSFSRANPATRAPLRCSARVCGTRAI